MTMLPGRIWQIQTIREGGRFDEQNRPVRTRVITYTLHKDGPFTLEVDESAFTGELAERLLDEQATHWKRLHPEG